MLTDDKGVGFVLTLEVMHIKREGCVGLLPEKIEL